jgi:hypothetical protein
MGRLLWCAFFGLTLVAQYASGAIQIVETDGLLTANWYEDGDAGSKSRPLTTSDPQVIPLREIHGSIGDGNSIDGFDTEDAFLLRVDGGGSSLSRFEFTFFFDEPNSTGDALSLDLYSGDAPTATPIEPFDRPQGDQVVYRLEDGLYVLEIGTTLESDPRYTILLEPGAESSGGDVFAAAEAASVSEPASLAIWALSACVAVVLRRRRSRRL